MKTSTAALWAISLSIACASSVSGCSSDATTGTGTAGTAGSGTAGAGTAGNAGDGAGGGSGGEAGSTGSAGDVGAGAGGASGSAGAGTSGSAGAGTSGSAGAGTSGSAGAGTSGSGGASGSAGTGGTGGTGTATAKFCNNVAFGTASNPMDITLRVDIGTAPDIISISALTGTCVPLSPAACAAIASGTDVEVDLIDPAVGGGTVLAPGTIPTIADGDSWLFVADIGTTGPDLSTSILLADPSTCSSITFADVFPKGPPPAQPALRSSTPHWMSASAPR